MLEHPRHIFKASVNTVKVGSDYHSITAAESWLAVGGEEWLGRAPDKYSVTFHEY